MESNKAELVEADSRIKVVELGQEWVGREVGTAIYHVLPVATAGWSRNTVFNLRWLVKCHLSMFWVKCHLSMVHQS